MMDDWSVVRCQWSVVGLSGECHLTVCLWGQTIGGYDR